MNDGNTETNCDDPKEINDDRKPMADDVEDAVEERNCDDPNEINEDRKPVADDVEDAVEDRNCDDPKEINDDRKAMADDVDDAVEVQNEEVFKLSLRDEESNTLGAEIFFHRSSNKNYSGWDNLRWMSYSGMRKITFLEQVYRFVPGRRTLFWSGDQYLERKLAIYDDPNLILILRSPESLAELHEILDLPVGSSIPDAEASMKSFLVVESVIDPHTSKLRLSPLTTVTSVSPNIPEEDFRRRSCFELVTPFETIALSSVMLRRGAERALTSFTDSGAFLETSTVEHSLQKSICAAHAPSQGPPSFSNHMSWKHQIILGTLHSHVVLGDQSSLDQGIAAAIRNSSESDVPLSSYLDPRIIDAMDESGRTPLHYACLGRLSAAVTSLVKAGASVDNRIEPNGMTPSHIAALHLDSKSLAAILTANRRPNVVDSFGRTPSYLAILEGHSVGGIKDAAALDSCLSVLESHGGEIEPPIGDRHPICYLAARWEHEELAVLLKHVNHRYPVVLGNVTDNRRVGISISAFYQYPIHTSLVAFREKIKLLLDADKDELSKNDFTTMDKDIVQTLAVLLNAGFEPNERLEGILEKFTGFDELHFHTGYAPIQIIGAAALDVASQKSKMDGGLYMILVRVIATTAEFLVKNGARLSLDPPPKMRSKDRESFLAEVVDTSDFLFPIDRSQLKISSNKQLTELLGAARLASAEKAWCELKSANSARTFIFHTDKLAIEDSAAPGGSDVKSCSVCWKPFGTITNRKHRCRISRRHVCDECSSKRVIENEEEHRISDGQFLLARSDHALSMSKKRQQASSEFDKRVSQQRHVSSATVRLERLEAEEKANRDSLFGNVMGNMAKAVFGEEEGEARQSQSHSDSIQGLSNTLNQTRNQLVERGEKLNTLAEKSDRLVNASKDFASMAKELNRQTSGGFFW